jgi:hypothetical protein
MRWFGEGALEKYPDGQLAGVLLYVTISSERGRWKSTHQGNSLASYSNCHDDLGLGETGGRRKPENQGASQEDGG